MEHASNLKHKTGVLEYNTELNDFHNIPPYPITMTQPTYCVTALASHPWVFHLFNWLNRPLAGQWRGHSKGHRSQSVEAHPPPLTQHQQDPQAKPCSRSQASNKINAHTAHAWLGIPTSEIRVSLLFKVTYFDYLTAQLPVTNFTYIMLCGSSNLSAKCLHVWLPQAKPLLLSCSQGSLLKMQD